MGWNDWFGEAEGGQRKPGDELGPQSRKQVTRVGSRPGCHRIKVEGACGVMPGTLLVLPEERQEGLGWGNSPQEAGSQPAAPGLSL